MTATAMLLTLPATVAPLYAMRAATLPWHRVDLATHARMWTAPGDGAVLTLTLAGLGAAGWRGTVCTASEWHALAAGDFCGPRATPPSDHARTDLVLDVSRHATGEAEVIYSDGRGECILPQLPGIVAIVTVPPGWVRHERRLRCSVGACQVVRLLVSISSSPGRHGPL